MAKRVKPASASERSRASRLRKKRASGLTLSRDDHRWLGAYDADRRKLKKQGGRFKPIPRRDRDRAYRLRRKEREGRALDASETRWLARYGDRVESRRRGRSADRSRRPSPLVSARRAARALGRWSGSDYEVRTATFNGGARAFVEFTDLNTLDEIEPVPTSGKPADTFPTETGQLIAIKAKIALDDGDMAWKTVTSVTSNWDNLPNEFPVVTREILLNYQGVGINGAEVVVWNVG